MSLIIDGSAGVTFPAGGNPQAAPAGVIQVVQATFTGNSSTTSASMVTTGFSATIAPKFSTSKILILATGNGDNISGGTQIAFSIYRNSTNLSALSFTDIYGGSSRVIAPFSLNYLDSPATTSGTVYTLYFASTSSAGSVTFNQGAGGQPSVATITLLEIAA